ncbi:MAG: helix-turn-helix domain-containing protein [Methanobrevibacter sp.]|nr:helix-turn-helix domain-containing protein [Methanobrevibacter sp.]
MDKKAFASCMKKNRENKKISIEDLGTITGISYQKLKEYESGEFDKIKASELQAIGKALDVPLLVLMKGGGNVHFLKEDEDGVKFCEWVEY